MAGYTQNSSGGYDVNYEDERFESVEQERVEKEANLANTYNNMLNNSDQYYNNQIKATQDYANKQSEIQQANTDFAIQQIEQQKEQAQTDYTKEQKGAYVDYMKQTKSNAQNMANSGLNNTGYSESSEVSIYNAYQNRVGTAKESLNRTIENYNNSMQQALLANNEALAEIAFNALQTENQLNQQAFEYKNSLILQKENALQELNDRFYNRYQDVLAQINSEIELQMALDQIDREYEQWEKEFNESRNQWQQEFELQKRETEASIAATNAQAAYYKEQASSLSANSNPYSNTNNTKNYEVNTPYYQGELNADAKNGTFSNGYQPDNINGNKLSATGDTITFNTQTLSGQTKTVTQNIWKTSDGKRYYWDGRYNKYIELGHITEGRTMGGRGGR